MEGYIMKKNLQILVETIVLNAIIFTVFFVLNPQKTQFLEMNIHPFLIITTFVGIRYGSYFGGFCATVASIFYILAYSILGRDLFLFFIEFSYYKFLLMFYLSAVVLGYYKDLIIKKLQDLRSDVNRLQRNYDQLRSNYKKTLVIKNELKKQIIGTEESILSLYEMASALESVDSEQIYTEVMGVLHKFLKAKRVSIYVINKYQSYLRLKVRFGMGSDLPNSIKISEYESFDSLIKSKKPSRRLSGKGQTPVFMAPLVQNDEIVGVINIEECDFEIITDYTFNLFKIIVDWTTKSLARALLVENSEKAKYYYRNTRVMKYERFTVRLEEEKKRLEKYGLEYIILKYKTSGLSVKKIDEYVKGVVREVDVLAYNNKTKILYFLFPVSPTSIQAVLEARILEKFENTLELIK